MADTTSSELRWLRWINLVEGISYLLLVVVAMPLKYLAGSPEAVQILGRIHGALFVLFVIALVRVAVAVPWGWRRVAEAFVLSLIPGGSFVLDRKLLSQDRARA